MLKITTFVLTIHFIRVLLHVKQPVRVYYRADRVYNEEDSNNLSRMPSRVLQSSLLFNTYIVFSLVYRSSILFGKSLSIRKSLRRKAQ